MNGHKYLVLKKCAGPGCPTEAIIFFRGEDGKEFCSQRCWEAWKQYNPTPYPVHQLHATEAPGT